MRYTTTDGRVIEVADMCGHCQLDTGGNHEPHCPFYHPPWETKVTDVKVNIIVSTK